MVTSTRVLGLILKNNLKWNAHVDVNIKLGSVTVKDVSMLHPFISVIVSE